MSSRLRHDVPAASVTYDLRAAAGIAFFAAASAAVGSLLDYEIFRAVAGRIATTDWTSATYSRAIHEANVTSLRAIAIGLAAFGATLLAFGPTVMRIALGKRAAHPTLTTSEFRRTSLVLWTLLSAVVLLGVRAWFLGYEGWDESTFIILASHFLDGHLPYLDLFELKPPGIFFALAGVMSTLGENLLAVRLFSAFCLLVSAVAGYAIAVRWTPPSVAGASMVVYSVLTCEIEFQGMLTEHLVLALIMPAFWLLVARRDRMWATFLIGILLSAATLTRTNIAYVVLALGAFYFWRFARPWPDVPRAAIVAYGLGGALPLGSLMLTYWLAGGLDIFLLSTFWAPLHYASSQMGMAAAFQGQVANWMHYMRDLRETTFIFVPATLLIGTGLVAYAINRKAEMFRRDDGILILVLGATVLSILDGGTAYGHYVLQVLPVVILLAATGFATLKRQPLGTLLFFGLTILIVGAGLGRFGGDSIERIRKEFTGSAPLTDLQRAANLINDDRCCGERVYAPNSHLLYWYLEQRPPSMVVHPGSLTHDATIGALVASGYLPDDEQQRVLEQDFGYIVIDPRAEVSWFSREHRRYFRRMVEERFAPWKRTGELVIYKRK